MDKTTISVSTSTLIKIAVVLLLFYFAYLVSDLLVLLFIAMILASLIDPLADWFAKKRMWRGVAVFLIYILVFGVLALVFILLVPIIVSQITQLSVNFSGYWEKIMTGFSTVKTLSIRFGLWENLQTTLPATLQSGVLTAQKLVSSIFGVFGWIFSFILVLVMAFYMVVEEDGFKKAIRSLAPSEYQNYLGQLWTRIKEKLGDWLRGTLALGLIIGAMSYAGLLILGVQYALLLAVIAGIFEMIPYAGPIFSGLVAVLLAFLQTGDWPLPVFTAILFIVIQQLENNLLVPKVMKKAVGLNPIVSILSLLIGFRLLGVVGALLSIPVATVLSIVWTDLVDSRSKK
ncbi:MAG: AI-2E family transporter [Candidatus Magasanikbacteria bacterium]|nr:AI-2E family transporter [Candidatus Magasanikbacteria bacterium]